MKLVQADFRPAETPYGFDAEPLRISVPDTWGLKERFAFRGTHAWMYLAVGSLLVSGLFALLLVVGRVPPFSHWISDPDFFRRCLVSHVNLSLLVWFSAFAASLFAQLPGARSTAFQAAGFSLAASGTAMMALSAFIPGSDPVLSNYIPFIDHPLFSVGLIVFFAGLTSFYLGGPIVRRAGSASGTEPVSATDALPADAAAGVRAAALAFLAAVSTFVASWAATPGDLEPAAYYEFVAWGGGHVLQVANVAAMVAVWLILAGALVKRRVTAPRTAGVLFGLLVLPHLAGPLLTIQGTVTPLYHTGFTRLMQFGIFPVVTVFILLCGLRLAAARREKRLPAAFWRDFRTVGLGLSILMTVVGFALGAMIRGSTTMIPAHYHASIGAVTVAFMAAAFMMAERHGKAGCVAMVGRWAPWQLLLFGGGQLLFALGFAVGGAFGLDRKVYGAEQELYSGGEYAGIAMMGIGGLVAVAGGVLFLALIGAAYLGRDRGARTTQANADL